jgi:hypothetical protein
MTTYSPEKLLAAHSILAEYNYDLRPVVRGYAGRTLYVDLTGRKFSSKPVIQEMKDLFTGGAASACGCCGRQ